MTHASVPQLKAHRAETNRVAQETRDTPRTAAIKACFGLHFSPELSNIYARSIRVDLKQSICSSKTARDVAHNLAVVLDLDRFAAPYYEHPSPPGVDRFLAAATSIVSEEPEYLSRTCWVSCCLLDLPREIGRALVLSNARTDEFDAACNQWSGVVLPDAFWRLPADETRDVLASEFVKDRVLISKICTAAVLHEIDRHLFDAGIHPLELVSHLSRRLELLPAVDARTLADLALDFPAANFVFGPKFSTLPPTSVRSGDVVVMRSPSEWICMMHDPTTLFVREHHEPLWQAVAQSAADALVIVRGSPGIGKTTSINYVLGRSLHDDPGTPVLVLTCERHYYFSKGSTYVQPRGNENRSIFLDFVQQKLADDRESRMLVLHDIKSAIGRAGFPYDFELMGDLRKQLRIQVRVVIFTSPQRSNIGMALKDDVDISRFTMPTWSLAELESLKAQAPHATLFGKIRDLEEAFYNVGGILRNLRNPDDSVMDMRDAINLGRNASFAACWNPDALGGLSSRIVRVCPLETATGFDYKNQTYDFVSICAKHTWLSSCSQGVVNDFGSILLESLRSGATQDVIVRQLEAYVGSLLDNSKPRAMRLKTFTARAAVVSVDLSGLLVTTFPGQTLPAVLQQGQLYKPKNPNFPFLDFLCIVGRDAWMIQVTVSRSHAPAMHVADPFIQHIVKQGFKPQMVWVGVDGGGVTAPQQCPGSRLWAGVTQWRWNVALDGTH